MTAVMICHPTANFLGHYVLPGLAARGVAGIGLAVRAICRQRHVVAHGELSARHRVDGDAPALDRVREGRAHRELGWRVDRAVLPGTGASHASVTDPPGGGPDLTASGSGARLTRSGCSTRIPSRALVCAEWLDPAIIDEHQPFERDPALDMFNEENGPPFSAEFIERYRRGAARAQPSHLAVGRGGSCGCCPRPRMRPAGLDDFPFVVHGTSADLRFLDGGDRPERPSGRHDAVGPAGNRELPARPASVGAARCGRG